MSEVTRLLDAVDRGEPQAAEELLPLVYQELRRLAAAKMAENRPGQTLQPTALVHEAWLRLLGSEQGKTPGMAEVTFLVLPPKPCDESSSITPGIAW